MQVYIVEETSYIYITADATLLAETDYGSPSSSIATTSWGTTIGNFAYRITVTKEGCSPVYYGFYGTTETNGNHLPSFPYMHYFQKNCNEFSSLRTRLYV